MQDRYGHRISYLRVSITDRCNERCTYCMPHELQEWLPREDILTYEETLRLIRIAAGPRSFYWDHMERALPMPTPHSETAAYVWVWSNDPNLSELLSDAEHYAHPHGPDNCSRGLIASAKAVVRAIKRGCK